MVKSTYLKRRHRQPRMEGPRTEQRSPQAPSSKRGKPNRLPCQAGNYTTLSTLGQYVHCLTPCNQDNDDGRH